VLSSLDPTLGEDFGALARAGLLDLGARPGKAHGAFCSPLPHRRQAIIFMTTTGGDRDLTSLAHETGHAFAMIEAGRALPLLFQREVGIGSTPTRPGPTATAGSSSGWSCAVASCAGRTGQASRTT
jgi:hypothetical protein